MADDVSLLALSVDSSNAVQGLNNVTRATGSMLDVIRQAMPALAGLFSAGAIAKAAGSPSSRRGSEPSMKTRSFSCTPISW